MPSATGKMQLTAAALFTHFTPFSIWLLSNKDENVYISSLLFALIYYKRNSLVQIALTRNLFKRPTKHPVTHFLNGDFHLECYNITYILNLSNFYSNKEHTLRNKQ